MRLIRIFGLLALCGTLMDCKREERRFEELPFSAAPAEGNQISPLQPGLPDPQPPLPNHPYEENAYAMSEGARLFDQYNCSGCHSHGGGMGPALMDDAWRYGSAPRNIFATIVEGRPNGMPSFRGRLPEQQVWQLTAFVRSLSGLAPSDAAPGRPETMRPTSPPQMQSVTPARPVPGEAEHPR